MEATLSTGKCFWLCFPCWVWHRYQADTETQQYPNTVRHYLT